MKTFIEVHVARKKYIGAHAQVTTPSPKEVEHHLKNLKCIKVEINKYEYIYITFPANPEILRIEEDDG